MKAKKKPIHIIKIEELGIDSQHRLEILKVEEPPKRKGGEKVSDVDGLIDKLNQLGAL